MQDDSFRHINLIDSLGHSYRLDVDDNPYLDKPKREIQATAGNDNITLSDAIILSDNTFNALAGDDIIVYIGNANITLHGGNEGDDILIIQGKGKNKLYGSLGNDKLYGGDDIYLFRLGDISLKINDEQDNDKLKILDNIICAEQFRLGCDDNNLYIIIRNTLENSDFITLENYFRSTSDKIESLVLIKDNQEVTYDIATLLGNMSSFKFDQQLVRPNQGMMASLKNMQTLSSLIFSH